MSGTDLKKRFLKMAYDQLNPNLGTLKGLEQALTNWYCFQYNVPPNDDKLLDMTLDELLTLRYMHMIRENPGIVDELDGNSYEEWLKKEMGEDYKSSEEMIAELENLDNKEQEFIDKNLEEYPDRIDTDFNKVSEDF